MSTPYLGQIILVGFNFAPLGYVLCNGQLLPIATYDALFSLIGTTYGGDGVSTFAVPDLRGRIPIGFGQGASNSYILGAAGGSETVTIGATHLPAHAHPVTVNSITATARCRNGAGNQASPVGRVPAIGPPVADAPLTPRSSVIRASDISDLRARVDGYRVGAGLAAYPYSDPTLTVGTTTIQARHIAELRAALVQAYQARLLTPPTFTDPALAAGTTVKAVHIAELRAAAPGSLAAFGSAAPDAPMHASAIALGGSPATLTAGGGQSHNNVQPSLVMNYCIAVEGIYPTIT
jgi:microcystin-dependent protein